MGAWPLWALLQTQHPMSALAKLGLGSPRGSSRKESESGSSAMSKLGLGTPSGKEKATSPMENVATRDNHSTSLSDIDSMLADGGLGLADSAGAQLATMGYLHKKSGGHESGGKSLIGKMSSMKVRGEHWSKRYFVMPADAHTMSYYKSEQEFSAGKEKLGEVAVDGATVYLKKVSTKGKFRFTVRTSDRELKLRAENEAEYLPWVQSLRPRVAVRICASVECPSCAFGAAAR